MFNIGDKVIINKKISFYKNEKATIVYIDTKNEFYRVNLLRNKFSEGTVGINYNNNIISCNIFYNHDSESIKLDLEEIRNDKLKSLGI